MYELSENQAHKSIAVVGRIPFDDEDSIFVFENVTELQAQDLFIEAIYKAANIPDPGEESDERIFINAILTSESPISVEMYT